MLGGRGTCFPGEKMIKWCDLVDSECSKVCYYQPKNQQFFRIINQQHPKFFVIFFSKINPDAHVSTKMNTITYYKVGGGGGSGGNSPRKPKKCKKGCFSFTSNDVDSDSCWGGGGGPG